MELHWRTNGMRSRSTLDPAAKSALAEAAEREAAAYAACAEAMSTMAQDAMRALQERKPALADRPMQRVRRRERPKRLLDVPVLVITRGAEMASQDDALVLLRERLETEGALVTVTEDEQSPDLDETALSAFGARWSAERLHAACTRAAAVVVVLSDATVEWLLELGSSADVGARGYTSESWIAWLSEDLVPAGADPPRRRHSGAAPGTSATRSHTRGMPRLMPVSLRPGALRLHTKAAAELLGGLGVLSLYSTSVDAEEQAAIRAFDRGVERPPLDPPLTEPAEDPTGGGAGGGFERGMEQLVRAFCVRALHAKPGVPSRFVLLCSSAAANPALRPRVRALKRELRERLGIRALDEEELWLCGDADPRSVEWHLKHTRRAFAVIAALAEPDSPPGQKQPPAAAGPVPAGVGQGGGAASALAATGSSSGRESGVIEWIPGGVLTRLREAGALLVPVVLTEQRLRRESIRRWEAIKGGRCETYENLGRRVSEPIQLSEPHAIERLRAELDQATELSHRLAASYEAAKGSGAGEGRRGGQALALGTTAMGRSGMAGGGVRSRMSLVGVDAQLAHMKAAGPAAASSKMTSSVSLPQLHTRGSAAHLLSTKHSGSPSGSPKQRAGKEQQQQRSRTLEWHARQAVATGGAAKWL